MSAFIVEGGHPLSGTIKISGNKNEALPMIAAALACPGKTVLKNVPAIGDVQAMCTIARSLGAEVSISKTGTITLNAKTINSSILPLELSSRIRGSILFASALLGRTGQARLPQPGGDTIGRRRLDTHFLVFKALGAKMSVQKSRSDNGTELLTYVLNAPKGLRGAHIYLDEASVTATENAIIAAALAQGTSVIANAASEPHVQGLCRYFEAAGVAIEGIGSNVLTIHGASTIQSVEHTLGCDYIEAGSFIGLAAATGSNITITDVDIDTMRMVNFQFERLGIKVKSDSAARTITIPSRQSCTVRKDLGGAIPRLEDAPWPGLPADLTSIFLVTATQCKGTCLIHEKMFESRLFFTDKLITMGAQIVLCDPHRAVVVGPAPLHGETISSPDIRAGMALLIAALAADGKSTIHNIDQIDRGYESIDTRLQSLGAHIMRVVDRRKK